jgi:predicted transcriptional regulator
MMELVRAVKSGYNEVNRNLRILEQEGIVAQQHIGRKRIIRLNLKSRKTSALLKALKILESANNFSATQFNFSGEFQLCPL